jgi:hypothetical protein
VATCKVMSAVLPPVVHKKKLFFGACVFREIIKSRLTMDHYCNLMNVDIISLSTVYNEDISFVEQLTGQL